MEKSFVKNKMLKTYIPYKQPNVDIMEIETSNILDCILYYFDDKIMYVREKINGIFVYNNVSEKEYNDFLFSGNIDKHYDEKIMDFFNFQYLYKS